VFTLAKVSAIMQVTMTRDSNALVLALATWDSMTDIETILSVSCYPRWPRQVKPCLHWRRLCDNTGWQRQSLFTCLGHLGWRDTDRIVSISCRDAQGCQGKYGHIAQGDCCLLLSPTVSLTNVANVNDPWGSGAKLLTVSLTNFHQCKLSIKQYT
jgi:hypothetical protein